MGENSFACPGPTSCASPAARKDFVKAKTSWPFSPKLPLSIGPAFPRLRSGLPSRRRESQGEGPQPVRRADAQEVFLRRRRRFRPGSRAGHVLAHGMPIASLATFQGEIADFV